MRLELWEEGYEVKIIRGRLRGRGKGLGALGVGSRRGW
jgi:hypothetical protein